MKYKLLKDSPINKAGDIGTFYDDGLRKSYNFNGYFYEDDIVENNPEWFAPFLFTTQDNVEVYEGDRCFIVDKVSSKINNIQVNVKESNYLYFSTKQAALVYLAKQKYPVGTKVRCYITNTIRTIAHHNCPKGVDNYVCDNGDIWLNAGEYNVMVYDDYKGKWAEIVPQFEVGKWYSVNNDNEFIKFSSSDKEAIYGEGVTRKHLKFHNNWWIYFNHIKNYKPLTDLSVIQPYLPDNHVDKVVDWKVGDIIAVKGTNIVAKITKIEDYYVSTDYIPAQDYRFLGIRKATESEIIAYYEKLGWVKGASFIWENNPDIETVCGLMFIKGSVLVNKGDYPIDIEKCKLIKQPELPKSWEDLKHLKGYELQSGHAIYCGGNTSVFQRGLFKTQKQAESALAFAQLSQLVAAYNDGWVANWGDGLQEKWCIGRLDSKINVQLKLRDFDHLPFKSEELAELSLRHHFNLWKTYYEL